MAATIEKVKTENPRELRKRIADLERSLREAHKAKVERVAPEIKIVEVSAIKESILKRFEKIAEKISREADRHGKALSVFWENQNDVATALLNAMKTTTEARPLSETNLYLKEANSRRLLTQSVKSPTAIETERHVNVSRMGQRLKIVAINGDQPLGKCELAILTTLAQHGECNMRRLALLSGYRKSGGFKNSISRLRILGYLEGPNTGVISITEVGLKTGQFDALPIGRDLFAYWLNSPRMGTCEREIMRTLEGRAQPLTIEEIAEKTGYAISGGFKNSLSKLRTAGVIDGRNTERMKLNEELI